MEGSGYVQAVNEGGKCERIEMKVRIDRSNERGARSLIGLEGGGGCGGG